MLCLCVCVSLSLSLMQGMQRDCQSVKMACGSNIRDQVEEKERRFNGELRLTQYTRERLREREKVNTTTLLKNNLNLCSVHRVCSMNTFIQVLLGLTEVLTVLQCSLKIPYTNS